MSPLFTVRQSKMILAGACEAGRDLACGGIKNCVFYSEELDAYLRAGDLIANGVRPVVGR